MYSLDPAKRAYDQCAQLGLKGESTGVLIPDEASIPTSLRGLNDATSTLCVVMPGQVVTGPVWVRSQ